MIKVCDKVILAGVENEYNCSAVTGKAILIEADKGCHTELKPFIWLPVSQFTYKCFDEAAQAHVIIVSDWFMRNGIKIF